MSFAYYEKKMTTVTGGFCTRSKPIRIYWVLRRLADLSTNLPDTYLWRMLALRFDREDLLLLLSLKCPSGWELTGVC